ncbi:MAG: sugar phosphate isomerase/epimerase [Bacteroidetes bacterium]|nr:sugar phosphate isomerase/epimerase [Bacteroidota bacterium]
MNYDRRKFVHTLGAMAAGSLILPAWACKSGDSGQTQAVETALDEMAKGSLDAFGLQLYTLRDDLPKDPKGILKQIASFGYKQIEGYEGDKGMFWGMGHTGFKQYLDELGMEMVASHCGIGEGFEEKAAQAGEIGMKYLICPWIGPQKTLADYKKFADQFNECGEICKQNGLRFAYHNHAYTFEETEGVMPQDFLMDNTDPELVDYEMDIYWVVTGGADPVAYMEKYGDRFRLCHVKDRLKDATPDEHEASCDLGTGSIDYAKILGIASQKGMKYYILEQERYDNSTPLKSAEHGAKYLSQLVFA